MANQTWTDPEHTRDCVSMQKNHMIWKFRISDNIELKFCRKFLHKNEKKVFSKAAHGYFMFKIGILWYLEGHRIEKVPFFKIMRSRPSPSHNLVSWKIWKCMTRFPILHILPNILRPFVFQLQFTLESPKLPKSWGLIMNRTLAPPLVSISNTWIVGTLPSGFFSRNHLGFFERLIWIKSYLQKKFLYLKFHCSQLLKL